MNIMETIAQIDALCAPYENTDRDAVPFNVFCALLDEWPTISAELKRLQEDNDALRSRLVDAEYNAETGFAQGVHDERRRQQAIIGKAREHLETTKRNLVQDKAVNGFGLFEPYIAQIDRALAALDGLASAAGDGWISVKDRLPEASGFDRYERLIQKPILVSTDKGQVFETIFILGGFANLNNRGNVTHWRPLPTAPIGGE